MKKPSSVIVSEKVSMEEIEPGATREKNCRRLSRGQPVRRIAAGRETREKKYCRESNP